MPDPETFGGALAVSIIVVVVGFYLERLLRRMQEGREGSHTQLHLGGVGRFTRVAYRVFYGRGLREYFRGYKDRLEVKLDREHWARHYANLLVVPAALRPADTMAEDSALNANLSVPQAVEQYAQTGLMLLGESGAGKSTAVKRTARLYCEEGKRVPILIDLRNYTQADVLVKLMAQEVGHSSWLARALSMGEVLLLLDGMNEIPMEYLPAFVRELSMLRAAYPRTWVVVTCRTADYTNNLPNYIHMRMRPLDTEEIIGFLTSLFGDEGGRLYRSLDSKLLGLCENPYMLTMLAGTYRSAHGIPTNRAKLYDSFLMQSLHEETLRRRSDVSVSVKCDLLSDLAFCMGNQVVAIDIARAQRIIGQKLIQLRERMHHHHLAAAVLDDMLSSGLVRLEFTNLSFMHQSVQEFYTARELYERLHAGRIMPVDLLQYAGDTRWHETLKMLAGLLPDATAMVKSIRKWDLLLAAECIYASGYVDPTVVDHVIVQAVTRWKYGADPFNYPLLFSLKRIADRRSANLAHRVVENLRYWCDKFALNTPRTMIGTETADLIRTVVEDRQSYILPDAIWTLGERKEVRAVDPLIDVLLERESAHRAEAARALGKIGDRRATASLLSCLKPGEPRALLPFCFMALGSIADPVARPELIRYLSDTSNPYRETAAWALLGIMDESIQGFLIDNLHQGTEYARAVFFFLLGKLKTEIGFQILVEQMTAERSPHVREDIAFSLGEHGDERAVPVLVRCLDDPDSVVRGLVAEALGKIGSRTAVPQLNRLLTDESEFVRDYVQGALRAIESLNKSQE